MRVKPALQQHGKKIFSLLCFFFILSSPWDGGMRCFAQGTWIPKAVLPAAGRWAPVSFTIGAKGYLGTGKNAGGSVMSDFWEYDPVTNSWAQKASFKGGPRAAAVGFSIGSYGYVGTGWDGVGLLYKDFWRYSPALNSWTQVTSLTGIERYRAVGFSIAGKGYIGTGITNGAIDLEDLWSYDPLSDTWTQKANYGGGKRNYINKAVFVICNKAYMGTGESKGTTNYNDFWEYDPVQDIWTQKANFPGTPRRGATGFSIDSKGFLGLGKDNGNAYNTDFWKYNPLTNFWSPVTAFPGAGRFDASSFVINDKAYLTTGRGSAGNSYFNDLWEFTPDSAAVLAATSSTMCFGQPATLSASGGTNYSWSTGSTNNSIVVSPASTTTYAVTSSDACGASDTAVVTVSVITVQANLFSGNICAGDSTPLIATGGTSYLWSNGATGNPITVSPTTTMSYSVIASKSGCTDTADCTVNVLAAPAITTHGTTEVTCTGGNDGTAEIMVTGGIPSYTYSWSPLGGTGSAAGGLYKGNYVVTVTDGNGCRQTKNIAIVESPYAPPVVPNAFSPNGDGENDAFCLQGNQYCIKEIKIIIYNRLGEKVYESVDPKFCWDGINHSGILEGASGTAVFAYYLQATLTTGESIAKKGNVSLLR